MENIKYHCFHLPQLSLMIFENYFKLFTKFTLIPSLLALYVLYDSDTTCYKIAHFRLFWVLASPLSFC